MTAFGHYARYYDALYADKDYAAEVDYVESLIHRYAPDARSMLELGCGTCAHAVHFVDRGWTVHGIDASEAMLAAARQRPVRLSSARGDMRSYRAGRVFDAVVSLFHGVSYQPSDADLEATFATARAHLAAGGLFLFDCWYGPAVLHDGPSESVKRADHEGLRITRTGRPTIDAAGHRIHVDYELRAVDDGGRLVNELRERHTLRYLFEAEIDALCAANGFERRAAHTWLGSDPPTPEAWSACFVVTAR